MINAWKYRYHTDEVGELHDKLGLEDGDDGLALEPYHLLDDPVPLGLPLGLHRRRRRRRGPPVVPGLRLLHQRAGRPARCIEPRPAGIGFDCSSRGGGGKDGVGERRCAGEGGRRVCGGGGFALFRGGGHENEKERLVAGLVGSRFGWVIMRWLNMGDYALIKHVDSVQPKD